jgi:hypothetical protein
MESLPKESRIVLALEALKKDSKLSVRKAATLDRSGRKGHS